MTSTLDVALIHKAISRVIDELGLFSEISSMGVCTTRHWQTSGRLVQELNVFTVLQNKDQSRARLIQLSKQCVLY